MAEGTFSNDRKMRTPRPSIRFLITAFTCGFFAVGPVRAEDPLSRRLAFAAEAGARIEAKPSVRGDDPDWFFLVKELRHLSTGRFWEGDGEEAAPERIDQAPGIIEFHGLLEARGVRLLLVPVPAKAAIYPEKLASEYERGDAEPLSPFLERLREAGVEVLDLEPHFLESAGSDPGALLYCRQDAHFSPAAAKKVAGLIAETLGFTAFGSDDITLDGGEEDLTITGDQVIGSEWEGNVPGETLPVQRVVTAAGIPVEPDPAGAVLLLGDSHTLVFQAGEENGMHCRGAGVFDHLALALGSAPDLVGVRGSGLVQARKQLFFRASGTPGYWESKKAVILLFSVRELTQSTDRPIPIPLDRR